jgi:LPXTG-motif cell wall-anchored protein
MRHVQRAGAAAVVVAAALMAAGPVAAADPIGAGEASAFGATIAVGGQEVVPPTPEASVAMPPGGDASETLIDIPADPLAVSGTLNADAAVHAQADIASELEVVEQAVAGPYNAAGVALIEGAEVLLDAVADDVSLVSADVIRAEAAAVCVAGEVRYTANSEIISLQIGGEDVPLNEPLTQLLDGLNDVLDQTGLNQVVDVQRNVVTDLGDGIAVDALVVTVLSALGDPLAEVRLGHAQVSGVACGALPECSDGIDNDGDGLIDFPDDPGCESPDDDSELDERTLRDEASPATGGGSDGGQALATLPATGGDASTAAIAAALAAGALGLLALRRRLTLG